MYTCWLLLAFMSLSYIGPVLLFRRVAQFLKNILRGAPVKIKHAGDHLTTAACSVLHQDPRPTALFCSPHPWSSAVWCQHYSCTSPPSSPPCSRPGCPDKKALADMATLEAYQNKKKSRLHFRIDAARTLGAGKRVARDVGKLDELKNKVGPTDKLGGGSRNV